MERKGKSQGKSQWLPWSAFLLGMLVLGQGQGMVNGMNIGPEDANQVQPATVQALKNGFDTLQLGMTFLQAEQSLRSSGNFFYQGQIEVSLSPDGQEKIIETWGGRYIKRGVLQFRDDSLYSIILDFNDRELDFYTIFTSYVQRYGEPFDLSNRRVVWQNTQVRVSLEKPLTLKYLGLGTFNKIIDNAGAEKSAKEENRESFINKL